MALHQPIPALLHGARAAHASSAFLRPSQHKEQPRRSRQQAATRDRSSEQMENFYNELQAQFLPPAGHQRPREI